MVYHQYSLFDDSISRGENLWYDHDKPFSVSIMIFNSVHYKHTAAEKVNYCFHIKFQKKNKTKKAVFTICCKKSTKSIEKK